MTTSIGAIHYQPCAGDPLDANWLFDHVDKAMYEAKRNGGNQVCLYDLRGEPATVEPEVHIGAGGGHLGHHVAEIDFVGECRPA